VLPAPGPALNGHRCPGKRAWARRKKRLRHLAPPAIYHPQLCPVLPREEDKTVLALYLEAAIPASVVKIGDNAFYGCEKITAFEIPDTVTEIGNFAFSESSLSSVVIPDSVTKIDERAFSNCKQLISVSIPDSVSSMGKILFDGCSNLKTVTIGNAVTEILDFVFANCTSLETVFIPASVINIHIYAFSKCTQDNFTVTVHPDNPVYQTGNSNFSEYATWKGKIKLKSKQ
jgi:hypothetical protein